MKYLHSLLFLALVTFSTGVSHAATDSCDSVRILISKSNDDTARIVLDSKSYLVPISFEWGQDLTWRDVKDSYILPPAYATLLKEGRISLYLGCSGLEFHVLKHTEKS